VKAAQDSLPPLLPPSASSSSSSSPEEGTTSARKVHEGSEFIGTKSTLHREYMFQYTTPPAMQETTEKETYENVVQAVLLNRNG